MVYGFALCVRAFVLRIQFGVFFVAHGIATLMQEQQSSLWKSPTARYLFCRGDRRAAHMSHPSPRRYALRLAVAWPPEREGPKA
eukprot:scaffold8581_cov109-Isochrysis_galbana.AAC.8